MPAGAKDHHSTIDMVDLSSKEHSDLLDVIDRLRSQGISRYVDLPQIVVCGDQSSGKSSVLEAISGVPFPVKDSLCTRFATEVILRRDPRDSFRVTIQPGDDNQRAELIPLEVEKQLVFSDFVEVVEQAKVAMGLSGLAMSKVFTKDVLRIELSGPERPHLTIVDLPGLFEAGSRSQSEEDAELVKSLVLSYMKKQRTIILAVVSAKNDFNVQSVTKYARKLDPRGERTLGLITKPDTLDAGSDSERAYLRLAANDDVAFRLGWRVVRNRDYNSRDMSIAERNEQEREFFLRSSWASQDPMHLGVENLKTRLSGVLRDLILRQLPRVVEDSEVELLEGKNALQKLGPARSSLAQQRQYIHQVAQDYTNLARCAIDGSYSRSFFTEGSDTDRYSKRLRAVVQNSLLDFAAALRDQGHTFNIVDARDGDTSKGTDTLSCDEYVDKVKVALKETRGRELPGTYNPLVVEVLFQEQSLKWRKLIDRTMEKIIGLVYSFVTDVIRYVADDLTAERLLQQMSPSMRALQSLANQKAEEIYRNISHSHPITYNHYFTENLRKAQQHRQEQDVRRALEPYSSAGQIQTPRGGHHSTETIIRAILDVTGDPDMDRYASRQAMYAMQAYYKVAMKHIVDDIAKLAIEQTFLQGLDSLLDLDFVCSLTDHDLNWIAAETDTIAASRERLERKIKVLESAIVEMKAVSLQLTIATHTTSDTGSVDDDKQNEPQALSTSNNLAPTHLSNQDLTDLSWHNSTKLVSATTLSECEIGEHGADDADEWTSMALKPKKKKARS